MSLLAQNLWRLHISCQTHQKLDPPHCFLSLKKNLDCFLLWFIFNFFLNQIYVLSPRIFLELKIFSNWLFWGFHFTWNYLSTRKLLYHMLGEHTDLFGKLLFSGLLMVLIILEVLKKNWCFVGGNWGNVFFWLVIPSFS